jgi:hypothetical protein
MMMHAKLFSLLFYFLLGGDSPWLLAYWAQKYSMLVGSLITHSYLENALSPPTYSRIYIID